ncbi:metallopeptidase TldD-related protein [Deferrisoma sp.]
MIPSGFWDRVHRAARGAPWQAGVWWEEGIRVEGTGGNRVAERWTQGYVTFRLDLGRGRVGFASAPWGPGARWAPEDLVDAARQAARAQDPVPGAGLEGPVGPAPRDDLGIYDPAVAGLSPGDLAEAVRGIEASVRSADPRVASVRKPAVEVARVRREIRTGAGEAVAWEETEVSASAEAAAEADGGARSGWASAEARCWAGLDPEAVGREAALRAAELLGGRPCPTGRFPLVLDARVAADLLDVLAPSFVGENVEKGFSVFRELGEAVAPAEVTLADEGLRPGGLHTQPVDDEGEPRRTTVVVDQGELAAFLHDRASGRRAGVGSTGNAVGGPGGPPGPDVTNLVWRTGSGGDLATLLGRAGRGLLVRELLGLHTADPVTGEFSVGCAGVWFEGGEPAYPVTGGALSGTLPELLRRVAAVGSVLEAHGHLVAPAVLVEGMDLAG